MKHLIWYVGLALVIVMFTGRETVAQTGAQSGQGSWSMDVTGGVPYTQFTVPTALGSPEYGFGFRYNFSPQLALRADFIRGVYESADDVTFGRDYRNEFYRFGLKPEFTFLRTNAVAFSVFGGIEGLQSDVSVAIDASSPAQYAGVEQQSFDMGFAAGAAVRFRLSRYFDFVMQAEQHITSSRTFDGYDKEITTTGDTYTQDYLDRFVTMTAGLTIKFGQSGMPHKLWDEQDASDEIARLKSRIAILEKRLNSQSEQDKRLFTSLANLQDSLSSYRSMETQMQHKHSRMLDSLQTRLNKLQSSAAQQEKQVETPLPTGNYYIIGGSFDERSNAVEFAENLRNNGMKKATIIPPTTNSNYYKVSYTGGHSRREALNMLSGKYRQQNPEAWLLEYQGTPMSVN